MNTIQTTLLLSKYYTDYMYLNLKARVPNVDISQTKR